MTIRHRARISPSDPATRPPRPGPQPHPIRAPSTSRGRPERPTPRPSTSRSRVRRSRRRRKSPRSRSPASCATRCRSSWRSSSWWRWWSPACSAASSTPATGPTRSWRRAVECVVQDNATVSFGHAAVPAAAPHAATTATSRRDGGQPDPRRQGHEAQPRHSTTSGCETTADSAGTLGSLDATITWSTDGIKQTVQDIIPLHRRPRQRRHHQRRPTAPSSSRARSAASRPSRRSSTADLTLQVIRLTGLGFTLPRESGAAGAGRVHRRS